MKLQFSEYNPILLQDELMTGRKTQASEDWDSKYELFPRIAELIPNAADQQLKLKNILEHCFTRQVEFTDAEFPHTQDAFINREKGFVKEHWDELEWVSARETFRGSHFYVFNGISPEDIRQRAISDCYLMSVLGSLATKPGLIRRIFEIDTINGFGVYAVWMNFHGKWELVIIDDYFPSWKGKHIFASSNQKQNEIWTLIIQKAFAKLNGGYYKLEMGIIGEAFMTLTGAPYLINNIKSDYESPSLVWNAIQSYLNKGYVIAVGIKPHPDIQEAQKENGLIMGHAYSLLDIKRVIGKDRKYINLIQLRNPWARLEWKGTFSRSSLQWTDNMRNELEYHEDDRDDGNLWVSDAEFYSEFDFLHVCMVEPSFKSNSIDIHLQPTGQRFNKAINIIVNKAGKYSFSVVRRGTQYFAEIHERVSGHCRLTLARKDDNRLTLIEVKNGVSMSVSVTYDLVPGNYIALIEKFFTNKTTSNLDKQKEKRYQNWRDLVFTSYGSDICNLGVASIDNHDCLELEFLLWKDLFRTQDSLLHNINDFTFIGEIDLIFPLREDMRETVEFKVSRIVLYNMIFFYFYPNSNNLLQLTCQYSGLAEMRIISDSGQLINIDNGTFTINTTHNGGLMMLLFDLQASTNFSLTPLFAEKISQEINSISRILAVVNEEIPAPAPQIEYLENRPLKRDPNQRLRWGISQTPPFLDLNKFLLASFNNSKTSASTTHQSLSRASTTKPMRYRSSKMEVSKSGHKTIADLEDLAFEAFMRRKMGAK